MDTSPADSDPLAAVQLQSAPANDAEEHPAIQPPGMPMDPLGMPGNAPFGPNGNLLTGMYGPAALDHRDLAMMNGGGAQAVAGLGGPGGLFMTGYGMGNVSHSLGTMPDPRAWMMHQPMQSASVGAHSVIQHGVTSLVSSTEPFGQRKNAKTIGHAAATPSQVSVLTPQLHAEIQSIVQDVARKIVDTVAREVFEQIAMHAVESRVKEAVEKAMAKHLATHGDGRKPHRKVPRDVSRAVREAMRRLIGCRMKKSRGNGLKPYYVLPDPLGPGETREAPTGATLWSPDWYASVDEGVNADYIAAVITLLEQNGVSEYRLKPEHAADADLIRQAASTYFRQLRRQYKYRKDDAGKQKLSKKQAADKRAQRRARTAQILRGGVRGFQRAFGKSSTVGLRRLIRDSWVDDECSSDGGVGHEERERLRKEQGAGQKALERRQAAWRSRKLSVLYIVLGVFAQYRKLCESDSSGDSAPSELDSDDSTSESELSDDEKKAYLSKVILAQKNGQLAASSTQRCDRFRGSIATASLEPHKKRNVVIYKECLSRKWRKNHPTHARKFARAPSCPDTFTILNLAVPEELIPEEDRGWLADTEDEASGEGDDREGEGVDNF